MSPMNPMNPMAQLTALMDGNQPCFSAGPGPQGLKAWRAAAADKLRELVGLGHYTLADPALRVEGEYLRDGYREIRFVIAVEEHFVMPCHLLLPDGIQSPPLMVCLQGHSTGMHISLGQARFAGDEAVIAGGRDFALQAVRRGMAALVPEQRYFGERSEHPDVPGPECAVPAMAELLLGRTAIAGRVWDVSRALDAVAAHFPGVDMGRVGVMGNSGGGTAAWYAACLEPRITAAMPSCAVCSFRRSIAVIRHCACNHIPGILPWFEMGDLAVLIAPRPLVVVAGREDDIFPFPGVEEAFGRIKDIYAAAGAPTACRLVVGDGGHRFYPQEAWPVFGEAAGW